jgi:hypothetical protein
MESKKLKKGGNKYTYKNERTEQGIREECFKGINGALVY